MTKPLYREVRDQGELQKSGEIALLVCKGSFKATLVPNLPTMKCYSGVALVYHSIQLTASTKYFKTTPTLHRKEIVQRKWDLAVDESFRCSACYGVWILIQ
eukprot:IDg8137t1